MRVSPICRKTNLLRFPGHLFPSPVYIERDAIVNPLLSELKTFPPVLTGEKKSSISENNSSKLSYVFVFMSL